MKDGPPNTPEQKELDKKDSELTKVVLLGLVGVLIAATLTVGANAAYLLIALSAAGTAIYYQANLQEWLNAHQTVWIGAAAGFFFGGASFGPIGMAFGAWLGHLAGQTVNNAMKVVDTVTAPITYAKETTNSAWTTLQSGASKAYQFVAGFAEASPEPEVATIEKETPVKPVIKHKRVFLPQTKVEEKVETPQPKPMRQRKTPVVKPTAVEEPIVKKPKKKKAAPAPADNKGWNVWGRLTNLFSRQAPASDKIENKEATAKPLTWQRDKPKALIPARNNAPQVSRQKPSIIMTLM